MDLKGDKEAVGAIPSCIEREHQVETRHAIVSSPVASGSKSTGQSMGRHLGPRRHEPILLFGWIEQIGSLIVGHTCYVSRNPRRELALRKNR
eukprot:scaffold2859_cov349-Pavlova_lutheri.AAC.42